MAEPRTYVMVKKADGITWVIMNRPEKRNAMSPDLHYEMDATLAELETDPETQVLVLTGVGEAFSAGQDLQKFGNWTTSPPSGSGPARRPIAGGGIACPCTTSRPSPW